MYNPKYWKPITWPSRIVIALIDLYRLSFAAFLGGQCRFYPSCSQYARQSLQRHGLLKGGMRSLWRLVRCNPWHPGGLDQP